MRNIFASISVHLALATWELVFGSCSRVSPPESCITEGFAFCTPLSASRACPRFLGYRLEPRSLERRTYSSRPRVSAAFVSRCRAEQHAGVGDEEGGIGPQSRVEDVEQETSRLMSAPTIDIKLELQMLGVDHRDTFEKVDLARRLAEARVALLRSRTASGHAGSTIRSNGKEFATPLGGESPTPSGLDNDGTGSARRLNDPMWSSRGTSGGCDDRRGGSVDERYAKDLARAMRMGKPALFRELNGLGVPHSRLSDINVLARQYASARGEARREAAKASLESERDVERRVNVSTANFMDEDEERDASRRRTDGDGGGWRWGSWTSERSGLAESLMPWHRKNEVGYMEDGEEGGRSDEGAEIFRSFEGDDGGDTLTDELVHRGDAGWGNGVTRDVERPKSMLVPLKARASRMSSRELMSALDSLGVKYSVPSDRSVLEEMFVSAVHGRHVAVNQVTGDQVGGTGGGMIRLNPSPARSEKAATGYEPPKFRTYHAALEWARQLTLGDVMDDLRYRGVEVEPDADYSYVTRLLADEIIADEEMLAVQDSEEFRAEVERAMSMSVESLRRRLETRGVDFTEDSSKARLAHLLAEANVRKSQVAKGELPPRSSPSRPRSRTRDLPGRGKTAPGVGDEAAPVGDGRGRARQRTPREEKDTDARSPGSVFDDPFGFGRDRGRDVGDEDVLVELAEITRSVVDVAWSVAQTTASLAAGAAFAFLGEFLPNRESRYGADEEDEEDEDLVAGQSTGVPRERSKHPQRTKRTRRRAGDARRGLVTFARSSANRAGLTVMQGVASGIVRVAEGAADWAGGGVVAREYVLLMVAVFCLAFKRGVSSSIALLVVIRACRLAVQGILGGSLGATRRSVAGSTTGGRTSTFRAATDSPRGSRLPPREGGTASRSSRSSARGYKVRGASGEQGFRRRRQDETGPKRRRKRPEGTRRRSHRRTQLDDLNDEEWEEEGCKVM